VTQLLCYRTIGNRELVDGEVWVAITAGSPAKGGDGLIVWGRVAALIVDSVEVVPANGPGGPFAFSANKDYDCDNDMVAGNREVHDLDDAPPHIAAAWMKQLHLGKLTP
jgi:hypothetical protein